MRRLVMAAALVSTLSFAQETKPPASETARQLAPFLGTWKCTGRLVASPLGPERPTQSTATGKLELGGAWVVLRVQEKKTHERPNPVLGEHLLTYDAGDQKVHALWVDDSGGRASQTSDGWAIAEIARATTSFGPNGASSLTLEGDFFAGGQKMATRDVFIYRQAVVAKNSELEHRSETNLGGKWVPTMAETCKR